MLIGHSANEQGIVQSLEEHLDKVGDMASQSAAKFDAPQAGRLAGLWHDLGKADPIVQERIRGTSSQRRDHKTAGALLAARRDMAPLAMAIAGHHGGLPNTADLKTLLQNKKLHAACEAMLREYAKKVEDDSVLPRFIFEGSRQNQALSTDFFIRMLFSALVDADFLDTEQHFKPDKYERRESDLFNPDSFLKKVCDLVQEKPREGKVNATRRRLFEAALKASELPQGFFSFTAPTGAGKTFSTMAFALRHAAIHNLDRVIVVIPYTSVIEQTADEYRKALGHRPVLEHHSAVQPDNETEWSRLASENWDAPIVVTTSVQFFDSLHSNKPSRCRKLHNIARSVVILDEVQTLPPDFVAPILSALKELVANYQTTIVFSTATLPAFLSRSGFDGIDAIKEIVDHPKKNFSQLRRVTYSIIREHLSWRDVSQRIKEKRQVLAVVNTKKDALSLYQSLTQGTIYLSTNLCAAHRRKRFESIRNSLNENEPCRVVSTQLIEVGVDLDFESVFRAVGPLDSIVQAAGRCNREGKSKTGDVTVFIPEEGSLPLGSYRTGTECTMSLLEQAKPEELHDPALYKRYFRKLYEFSSIDKDAILRLRAKLDFPEVAYRFHLIPEDTRSVVVPYGEGKNLIEALRKHHRFNRDTLRQVQPYLVSLPSYALEQCEQEGLCSELVPGLWEWAGKYDKELGILMEGISPEKNVI